MAAYKMPPYGRAGFYTQPNFLISQKFKRISYEVFKKLSLIIPE
uniref:Uncharacterized protein n=1 Tax=uncultured Desulfobacterium sp. TaxID=201089 RepID=E1YD58_9BACT|nr:unknown protein [uncultured Desulfobacterium sp.]